MAHTPSHRRSRVRGGGRGRAGGRATGRSAAAQKTFQKSVSKARSRGIDSRSLAQKNAALEEAQKRADQQAKGSDDNRSAYLAKQATQPLIDRNKFLMDQEQRRANILSGKITPKKSDFTGFEGGTLGLRTGDYKDTGLPKIREGLTSAQYADYMRNLYDANPAMMEKMFPFASGKTIRNVSRFMPGLGTLQSIAGFVGDKTGDAVQGLKQIAIDRNILPNDKLDSTTGTTAVSGPAYDPAGLEGYRDAIMKMNQSRSPLEGFVPNPDDMNIAPAIAPDISPVIAPDVFDSLPENIFPETVTAPRRLTATNPEAAALMQQIMNKQINMVDGRDTVGDLQPMYGINAITMNPEQYILDNPPEIKTGLFNEGGLASINNPEYNMLMNASNFDL